MFDILAGPIQFTKAESFSLMWLFLVTPVALVLLIVGLVKKKQKLTIVSLCLLGVSAIAFFLP